MNGRAKRAWFEVAATALVATATALESHASLIAVGEVGDARASATNVDPYFDLLADANIFDSTTVAHASVSSTNDSVTDVDWYSFTGVAGATVFMDIDCGGGCGVSVDTTLSLFDGTGTVIARGDDSSPPDPGSLNDTDSFVGAFILPGSGTYFVAVSNYDRFPAALSSCISFASLTRPDGFVAGGDAVFGCTPGDDSFSGGLSSTGDYILHISNSLPIPEPSTLALLALGLAGLDARGRIRRSSVLLR